ncbi:flagellar basal-body rod modification protein FlgD [Pseudobutyrivibrio sp. YE44]|uniref:flagellar hook capping FlgD N-terminal domain-containing protein n=1 Tax=Pseudobutyrivibrio sp. YE44 TaxID=1520802 RepID=UPI0008809687|nr:flagellar hook capping FlgD N-terminal domain-containing protein [Pseudobutyrivibrio sp. YE44]SDB11294.1 flagellar basal-body rod modification protein FlgD [Pseudobutyrivibrio sp. YE44]
MAEPLLVGAVTNGEYTKTKASQETTKANETTTTSKSEAKRDTGYNKDMFLQLLVAEMQYQDPLEPSDNSQYVAQLASFTQIEAMQSVQDNMETIQSNSIVGKVVALNINGQELTGKVDFVTKDDKKGTMLSIDGELYEMSKMISVIDEEYYNAKYMASLLTDAIKKLPDAEQVTIRDQELIRQAAGVYNAMNDYDRSFVSEDLLKKYQEVLTQLTKLMEAMETADKEKEKEPTVAPSEEVTAGTEEQGAESTTPVDENPVPEGSKEASENVILDEEKPAEVDNSEESDSEDNGLSEIPAQEV